MRQVRWLVALSLLILVPAGVAAEPFRFAEARHGQGELKYINGVPVLRVAGKPAEIGEQVGVLGVKPASRLLGYPRDYLKAVKLSLTWPAILAAGKGLIANFPVHHLEEMESAVKSAAVDRDLFVAANTMFDIKKVIGCSSLIVEAGRSATGAPLFGRNLDFPTLGYLNEYSLVIVCRPEGKHAFASVGFPGCFGVLSGMNDAGLTLAVLECYSANDNSPRFDPAGIPYALCFRRLLEECTTVAEAETLLRSMKRTTRVNLAICDPKGGAVFEITPRTVAVRRSEGGVCPCTNHFCTKELAIASLRCWRFPILEKCCREQGKLSVADVARKLDDVNQGVLTLQSMIFEPATLKLHLALGQTPTSALPMKTLDLAPLLKK